MIGMTALGIVSSGNSAWGVRSVGVWGGTSGQTREGHLVISSITGPSYSTGYTKSVSVEKSSLFHLQTKQG